MAKVNTKMTRAYQEDINKLTILAAEIQAIQKKRIQNAEVLRRILNVPELPDILKKDAEAKKQRGIL